MRQVLIVILLLFITQSFASNNYRGQVLDAETNAPLIGVNIFFANTSIGTISDENGHFIIKNPNRIKTNLIFQHIGYEIVAKDLQKQKKGFLLIELKPNSVELQPVYVTAEKSWLQNYKREMQLNKFLDKFYLNKKISDKYCDVLNTEYLHFNYTKSLYEVTCDTLLIVKNEYLGYRKKIAMESFNWTKTGNHFLLKWSYFINYDKLEPKDDQQTKTWQDNREFIYKGTFRHFVKTLLEKNSFEEGFKIFECKLVPRGRLHGNRNSFDTEFEINALNKLKKSNYHCLNYSETFSVDKQADIFIIDFNLNSNYLIVEYQNRIKAFIKFETDKMYCDQYGNLMNLDHIIIGGDWQNYGIESILPMDYKLGD